MRGTDFCTMHAHPDVKRERRQKRLARLKSPSRSNVLTGVKPRVFSARSGGGTDGYRARLSPWGRGRWSFRPIWLPAASRGLTPAWFSPATIDQDPVVLVEHAGRPIDAGAGG
jgi:hypothetical protein